MQPTKLPAAAAAFLFIISFSSCSSGPEPIKTGIDQCYFCKMTISDARFGAELITTKGKIYKFDDMHCVLSYLKINDAGPGDIRDYYLTDFSGTHRLIPVHTALLLKSDELRSPMGGNVAAFDNGDSLVTVQKRFPGNTVTWND